MLPDEYTSPTISPVSTRGADPVTTGVGIFLAVAVVGVAAVIWAAAVFIEFAFWAGEPAY